MQDQGPPAAALIVDHGLRPESGVEAEHVAGMAAQLGLLPHVLRIGWRDGKPRQQEKMVAAREERYHLMAQECSRLGRQHLLVAQHAGGRYLHMTRTYQSEQSWHQTHVYAC